mmetsp:Transcript_7556/g.27623  ORF Transcript_7556/g.27623 Transcript_7556/m.27623 type:complete len:249 (+) Transcript_7556:872-1618(+)
MRAWPSYEPVASRVPSAFQSSVVTSLLLFAPAAHSPFLFSSPVSIASPADAPSSSLLCSNTFGFSSFACASRPDGPAGTDHTRAVESPEPDAKSCLVGFHAQIKTSLVCPSNIVTSSLVISRSTSLSILMPSASALARNSFSSSSRCALRSSSVMFRRFVTSSFNSSTLDVSKSRELNTEKSASTSVPSSFKFASSSRYCNPFCTNEIKAPGGIAREGAIDFRSTYDSFPNANALCVNPDSSKYLYTR